MSYMRLKDLCTPGNSSLPEYLSFWMPSSYSFLANNVVDIFIHMLDDLNMSKKFKQFKGEKRSLPTHLNESTKVILQS